MILKGEILTRIQNTGITGSVIRLSGYPACLNICNLFYSEKRYSFYNLYSNCERNILKQIFGKRWNMRNPTDHNSCQYKNYEVLILVK